MERSKNEILKDVAAVLNGDVATKPYDDAKSRLEVDIAALSAKTNPKKVKVYIPKAKDSRWKSWRKLLTGVDTSHTNGYAFQGSWLYKDSLVEIEDRSYILMYDVVGSRKHCHPEVDVFQAQGEDLVDIGISASGNDWALKIRDRVSKLFE